MNESQRFTVRIKKRNFKAPTDTLFGTPNELVQILHDGFQRTGNAMGFDVDDVRKASGRDNRQFIAVSMEAIVLITGVVPLWYLVDPRCTSETQDYDTLFLDYMARVDFLEFVGAQPVVAV